MVSAECHPPKTGADPVAFKSLAGAYTEMNELRYTRRQVKTVASGDIIYCQRPIYKRLRALYLLSKHTEHPFVFDFDDAVFLNRPDMTRWFLERADLAVAGNRFLETYAEWYSDRVVRIPTAVPFEVYQRAEYEPDQEDPFRIGWVGNAQAHRENLRSFSEILTVLAEAYDDALETCDVLALPTMPMVATRRDEIGETDFLTRLANTSPFDATGHPAISIPCGGDEVGLMLVGRRGDDGTVLDVAHAAERALSE